MYEEKWREESPKREEFPTCARAAAKKGPHEKETTWTRKSGTYTNGREQ